MSKNPSIGRGDSHDSRIVRALVVEDDSSWQQILTELLTDTGLGVDSAGSYEEAEAVIRQNPHRLAVLDLSLGGPDHNNQDGLRVANYIRKHDPTCSIIFLTGFATVELAVQVMQEMGAFTCLRKEVFRRADFRQVINQAMALAPAARADRALEEEQGMASAAQISSAAAQSAAALIVEDDPGWRELLTELLTDAGLSVRTSASYVEAIGLLKRERFNLTVVDLSLASSATPENQDGFRLLAGMQKDGVPVIVVSGYVDPAKIEQAYSDRLIYACLEKQAFDRKAFTATVLQALRSSNADPVLDSLTEREREVLVLLARGLTNKEIAKQLIITTNTVKRHLKSLFAKLDVGTRSAASSWASTRRLDR